MSNTTALRIAARTRSVTGKQVAALRREGTVPAVVYGHGVATVPIEVNEKQFLSTFEAAGESSLIDLAIGEEAPVKVLIHDIQSDPRNGRILHVDFYRVRMTEKITTDIKLVFTGVSPAVKEQGGVLVKNLTDVKVRCLPQDLLPEIPVDITALKGFEDRITITDLHLPSTIEVLGSTDDVVASVTPPRSEAELAALEETVVEAVETVEKVEKKKKEEESAEGEAGADAESSGSTPATP